jgi:NAD-dependent dihydropyrimidine dehydrogenase PreA subunit
MIMVTEQKSFDEITQMLDGYDTIYIIGCGSCATMLHTGGKSEVNELSDKLEAAGKKIAGWMVIPTVCDELSADALAQNESRIREADCVLVMSCAFGVQTIAAHSDKRIFPALNTLFMGKEEPFGSIAELCMQCGICILDRTAGICPVANCAKSLLNGPCGGSVNGKCEVSSEIPCAWQLIIDRLTALNQLDELEKIQPIKDWSTSSSGFPRRINLKN